MFNPFKKTKKEAAKEIKRLTAIPVVGTGSLGEKEKPEVRVHHEKDYLLNVLIAPRLTEKSTMLSQRHNQYVFEIAKDANASMAKRAVQEKYGVRVKKVNIINQRGKEVRIGRRQGWRPGFKKAIVTVAEGQRIEVE